MKNEYIDRAKIEKWVGFTKKTENTITNQLILLTASNKNIFYFKQHIFNSIVRRKIVIFKFLEI